MPPQPSHPPRRSSSNTQLVDAAGLSGRSSSVASSTVSHQHHQHRHHQHQQLHGAVASRFLAQPPTAYGGETWVDFLREHAGREQEQAGAPGSRRRLTEGEAPVRRAGGDGEGGRQQAGSSAELMSAPRPPVTAQERPLPPPPSYATTPSYATPSTTPYPPRRESDLVLPPWQPDAQVTQCPVCSRHFTFTFRKHHCRKCGRVVCGSCSPHRITIPRQFIVHPPSDASIAYLTGDDDANYMSNFAPFHNPALGGGEEVRVCNPCVPDPNYSLPPQYASPASHVYGRAPPPPRPHHAPTAIPPYQRAYRSSSGVHVAPHPAGQAPAQPPPDLSSNRRVSYHDPSRSEDRWPSPLPNLGHVYSSVPRHYDQRSSSSRPPTGPTHIPQAAQHRANSGSSSVRSGDMFPRQFFVPTPHPPSIQQLNPRPRRQIAEEDECPICGGELPPKGPNGDDSARSQHIEECIALHSSSPAPNSTATRPQAQTSASLPTTRTRGMSSAGAGEGPSLSHRHSHAARGMFPYVATEKDCVDEDGEDAECVICFEEFQPGDRMSRLVCWCKFHKKCIKEWWKMKGRGACPTHQLHEE